ncbi:MAG: hypothetical protein ACRC29_02295, partial [Enterobacterales bacterium]
MSKRTSPRTTQITHRNMVLFDVLTQLAVRPESFGGVGDGVVDDTAAIRAAIAAGTSLDLSGKKWKITDTLDLPDGYTVNMRAARISADTGTKPLFTFSGKNLGLNILGGAGVVTGTAGSFLELIGDSDTPANADYAKQIRIYGVHVSSQTITYSILMTRAVRQVFIDSCMFYTVNGVVSRGKSVEVMITKSIIFGSTAGKDTAGIGLYSTGGNPYYNEGWHITDCTIDNFERTFDVADIYVLTVTGGFIGNNSTTGHSFYFAHGNTSHCREISIHSVIGGRIKFNDSNASKLFHAKISGEVTYCKGGSGVCLQIGANAAGVDVRGLKFTTNEGHTVASVADGAANIHFDGISTDSSHTAGIVFNGETGGNCSISDYVYAGTGEALSLARAVRLSNVPAIGTNTVMWSVRSNYISATKTVARGSAIAQTQMTVARASKVRIDLVLSFTGGAASNAQFIGVTAPTGVLLPSGSNFQQFVLPATSGVVTLSLIATTTADFKNAGFVVDNRAGNTLTVLVGSTLSVSL